MKNIISSIGIMLILAGGAMADSVTLTPTIVCVMLGGVMILAAEGLFKYE